MLLRTLNALDALFAVDGAVKLERLASLESGSFVGDRSGLSLVTCTVLALKSFLRSKKNLVTIMQETHTINIIADIGNSNTKFSCFDRVFF